MSALASCSAAAPFVARATKVAARKGASNRRGNTRVSAVTEPVETSPSAADPIEAFCADQMPDEAAMLAASTFPISPEVRHACVRECACALVCVCLYVCLSSHTL